MRLQIQVSDDGRIEDAKSTPYGCSIASSSLVTEWVKGRTIDEALEIKNKDIADFHWWFHPEDPLFRCRRR